MPVMFNLYGNIVRCIAAYFKLICACISTEDSVYISFDFLLPYLNSLFTQFIIGSFHFLRP